MQRFFVVVFLITKKRKVQATEHASAEPANDAEMKHTVSIYRFNGQNATNWMAAVHLTSPTAIMNSCRAPRRSGGLAAGTHFIHCYS